MIFLAKERKAIYIMAMIARNGDKPLPLHTLEDTISTSYCEQFAHTLKRAGLIASQRGPGGGYTLTKSAKDITLGEIADIVRVSHTPKDEDNIDKVFEEALDAALGHLDSVFLSDVL